LLAGCGKSQDVLVVGTNASFAPFEYVESLYCVGLWERLACTLWWRHN